MTIVKPTTSEMIRSMTTTATAADVATLLSPVTTQNINHCSMHG